MKKIYTIRKIANNSIILRYFKMIENKDVLDIYGDGLLLFQILILLLLFEKLMKIFNWFPCDRTGQYFTLHVFINFYVTIVHLDDVFSSITNPLHSFELPTDPRGVIAIYALHIHHILFFRPLPWIDWVHHVLMVLIMLPCAYLVRPGPLLGNGAFWTSGLPGMIDYILLIGVKRKWIQSITEKGINSWIQLWFRQIGCVSHAILIWIAYLKIEEAGGLSSSTISGWKYNISMAIAIIAFLWNGPYFAGRVIYNYGYHKSKQ